MAEVDIEGSQSTPMQDPSPLPFTPGSSAGGIAGLAEVIVQARRGGQQTKVGPPLMVPVATPQGGDPDACESQPLGCVTVPTCP